MHQRAENSAGRAWRALRHRNFRLYFVGQSISLCGTWMTRIAISWLVYRLTGSAMILGAVGFTQQAPVLLLSPLAGVLIDHVDRRKLLLATQALAMAEALTLAALTLTHTINLPLIFALSLVDGLVGTLDMPLRQAFMPLMVEDRADLPNGIAINASMINAARLVGPSLAGLLIAATSEGWCFLVDGVSYTAVIASILMMRVKPVPARPAGGNAFVLMHQGWQYVSGSVPIRSILLLFAVVSLMGYPFVVLMPVFAAQVLHGGPHTLGFLMGAVGVGALGAAIGLAVRKSVRGLVEMLMVGAALFGVGLVGFGLSRYFVLSLMLMLVAGFGMIQGIAGVNTLLQTVVDDKMRGRVMSYYAMAFTGVAPFGSLLAGVMASRFGAPQAVMVSGVACLLGALWFGLRLRRILAEVEPVFERLGI